MPSTGQIIGIAAAILFICCLSLIISVITYYMTRKSTVNIDTSSVTINVDDNVDNVDTELDTEDVLIPLNENIIYQDEEVNLGFPAVDKIVIVKSEDGIEEEIYLDEDVSLDVEEF